MRSLILIMFLQMHVCAMNRENLPQASAQSMPTTEQEQIRYGELDELRHKIDQAIRDNKPLRSHYSDSTLTEEGKIELMMRKIELSSKYCLAPSLSVQKMQLKNNKLAEIKNQISNIEQAIKHTQDAAEALKLKFRLCGLCDLSGAQPEIDFSAEKTQCDIIKANIDNLILARNRIRETIRDFREKFPHAIERNRSQKGKMQYQKTQIKKTQALLDEEEEKHANLKYLLIKDRGYFPWRKDSLYHGKYSIEDEYATEDENDKIVAKYNWLESEVSKYKDEIENANAYDHHNRHKAKYKPLLAAAQEEMTAFYEEHIKILKKRVDSPVDELAEIEAREEERIADEQRIANEKQARKDARLNQASAEAATKTFATDAEKNAFIKKRAKEILQAQKIAREYEMEEEYMRRQREQDEEEGNWGTDIRDTPFFRD